MYVYMHIYYGVMYNYANIYIYTYIYIAVFIDVKYIYHISYITLRMTFEDVLLGKSQVFLGGRYFCLWDESERVLG